MQFVSFVISAISVLWWIPLSVWSLDYDFISVESSFTNGNYMSCELSREFISRGRYGVSGYIYFNKDILDDDLMVALTVGYNSRNYESFHPSPFHMGPIDFLSAVNGYYKKYVMPWLGSCSNAPQSNTKWENLEDFGKNITCSKCAINMETFKELRSGFYCITISVTKNVNVDTPFNMVSKFIIQFDNYS